MIIAGLLVSLNLLFINVGQCDVPTPDTSKKLSDCKICKTFVSSFDHWLDKTSRGKFEGGDAAWEESKLKNYARSEIRLIEVQEGLCSELKKNKNQCYAFAEEVEGLIEEWWFNERSTDLDLFSWLCIDNIKYCCPDRHYGPDCSECLLNALNQVCNGNGKCSGDGTRKGTGKCLCDKAYSGDSCDICSQTFYALEVNETSLICAPCHESCRDSCTQGGPRGCSECGDGWTLDGDSECVDINECTKENICNNKSYCLNQQGSYACKLCDKSCNTCYGDGATKCNKCAEGYFLNGDECLNVLLQEKYNKESQSRYLTYLGLCLITSFILRKSTTFAAFIGVIVALYISISEYMIRSKQGTFFIQ